MQFMLRTREIVKSLGLTKHHDMKTYGGSEVWFHAFLTLVALDGGGWLVSHICHFTAGERAVILLE